MLHTLVAFLKRQYSKKTHPNTISSPGQDMFSLVLPRLSRVHEVLQLVEPQCYVVSPDKKNLTSRLIFIKLCDPKSTGVLDK